MAGDDDVPDAGGNRYAGPARNVLQARDIGVVNFYSTSQDPDAPYALPLASSRFQDREPQLRQATEAVLAARDGGAPALVVVAGLRGVGKTAMAVHWAGLERDRFPDGMLYADLGGGLSRRGLGGGLGETATVLLEQLGVSGEHLPHSDQGRLALLRTRLARRKVFLLLDNARLAREVNELLPRSPGSVVFVTTDRERAGLADLAGRHDAEVIELRELPERDGLELLRALAGAGRVDREPEGARALLRACGGWPQALRLAAGQLKVRPQLRLADLAARMEAVRRDPGGAAGEWIVHVVSDETYGEMPGEVRRAYRLLALHPGGGDRPTPVPGGGRGPAVTFGTGAAAALLDRTETETGALLEALADRHLIDFDAGTGRHIFHDLVRAHARGRAEAEESGTGRDAAVDRVSDWYLRAAAEADLAINPHRRTTGPVYEELRGPPSPYGTGRDAVRRALAWLRAEHRNLCAIVYHAGDRGRYDIAWQLCEALWGFYLSLKHYDQWIETHRVGLHAAEELGLPGARFRMGIQLGRALYETRRFDDAHKVLGGTLEVVTEPLDRATTLEFIGRAHLDAGRPREALGHFVQAAELAEAHDHPRGVAINMHHLARAHLALGDAAAAMDALTRALEIFTAIPDAYNRGRVLHTLGRLHLDAGRAGPASGALHEALEIMRAEDRTYQVGEITESLARLAGRTGDQARARELRETAIAAYDAVGSPRAAELRDAGSP